MSDEIAALYESREYPPMSHPASHPAVAGVAAAVAGLRVVEPGRARVLEIGCGSGWNLLAFAAAHPGATCHGMDFSARGVALAREFAAAAGIRNATFEQADLRTWEVAGEWDHVMAHGVFSWIEPAFRHRLLATCREALAAGGIACLGFNTRAGWGMRRQLIELTRVIAARSGDDPRAPLATLGMLEKAVSAAHPHGAHVRWLLGDMRAKGREVLPFDDFAPVCDAVSLSEFAALAGEAGLRVLGESDLAANMAEGVDGDALAGLADSPWLLQEAADLLGGRAHREVVLCRADVAVDGKVTTGVVLDLAARMKSGVATRPGRIDLLDESGGVLATSDDPLARRVFRLLDDARPSCVAVREVLAAVLADPVQVPAVAGLLFDSARAGWIELRTEAVPIGMAGRAAPALSRVRREAVRRRWPLVDAWHRPCTFGEDHYRLLAAFDGTRTFDELEALAAAHCPGLAFRPWFDHLLERGLFGA